MIMVHVMANGTELTCNLYAMSMNSSMISSKNSWFPNLEEVQLCMDFDRKALIVVKSLSAALGSALQQSLPLCRRDPSRSQTVREPRFQRAHSLPIIAETLIILLHKPLDTILPPLLCHLFAPFQHNRI